MFQKSHPRTVRRLTDAIHSGRRRVLACGLGLALIAPLSPASAAQQPPASCSLASSLKDPLVRLAFETVDGRIYVPARVNGRGPFRFAVDTGASGMARADRSLVQALALPERGQASNSDGVSTASAATTELASIQLDGLVRTDMEVITRDYAGTSGEETKFSGILARGFFGDGLLVIDFPGKTLSFSRESTLPADAPGVLRYERAFRVPVSIGAVQAVGNLDTGANVSFVLPRALYDTVARQPLLDAGRASLSNGKLDLDRGTVTGPFQVGALRLSDVEVRVSERYPELLVGAHVLQDAVVLIDQRTQAIAICP
jgi:predicted aspartyl protease